MSFTPKTYFLILNNIYYLKCIKMSNELNSCDSLKDIVLMDENTDLIRLKYALAYNDTEELNKIINKFENYGFPICSVNRVLTPLEYAINYTDKHFEHNSTIQILLKTNNIPAHIWDKIFSGNIFFSAIFNIFKNLKSSSLSEEQKQRFIQQFYLALKNAKVVHQHTMDLILQYASWYGDQNLVELSIEKGANLLTSALNYAIKGENIDLVRFFLHQTRNKSNAFITAVGKGNRAIVDLMIENGAHNFNQGLFTAISSNKLEMVSLMLEKGATNLNEAFEYALNDNNKDIALYLLQPTFDTSGKLIKFRPGFTELQYVFYFACQYDDQRLLEATINDSRIDFDEALYYACRGGHKNMVDLTIAHRADQWNKGLFGACEANQIEMAKYMIEKGADDLYEAFQKVCENLGSKEMQFMLIEHGANIDYTCDELDEQDLITLYSRGVKNFGKYQPMIDDYLHRKAMAHVHVDEVMIPELNNIINQYF
jgi:ankyrin repeat protein